MPHEEFYIKLESGNFFKAVALIRVCILFGGAVGVYANPSGGPAACRAIRFFII